MRWRRRFLVTSRERWASVLRALASAEYLQFPIEISVAEVEREKSRAQRAFFHATCDEVGAALGYTEGEFKDLVKCAFFGEGWEGRSTEDLDAEAYGRLIEVAQMLGAWAGFRVTPGPGSPGEPGAPGDELPGASSRSRADRSRPARRSRK